MGAESPAKRLRERYRQKGFKPFQEGEARRKKDVKEGEARRKG